MSKWIKHVFADRRGGAAVEYGLIAAMIVMMMLMALGELANQTVGMWGNVNTKVAAANGG
jgi:pilus assembly protein Flp/PilA